MHALLIFLSLQADVAAAPARRVLVLDIEAVGVAVDDANAVTRLVASAASEVPGVEVVSAADLRRLAALEADKMAAGCGEASCLAEIAGALGAESVLFGSLSRLGTTTTASLSLYTAGDGRTERRSVDVKDLSELTSALRIRTTELLSSSSSSSSAAVPDGPSPLPAALTIGGGSLALLGVVGLAVAELLVQQPERPGAEKATMQSAGRVAVGVGVVGVGVGVVGALLWWSAE
ncbi:MAG: hypothetical protein Q8O67_14490 [Deltaproteobacteria bacterium]|nr:hypothetical protein [Deltaproteobacteria bacterium]